MRLFLLALAERALGRVARAADGLRERVAVCRICGRNRYTGAPCGGKKP